MKENEVYQQKITEEFRSTILTKDDEDEIVDEDE